MLGQNIQFDRIWEGVCFTKCGTSMLREAVAGWAYLEPPLSKYSPHIHIILFPFKRENVNVFFPSFRNSEDRAKHGPRCFHIIFTIKQLCLLLFTLQKVPTCCQTFVLQPDIGDWKLQIILLCTSF